MWVACLSCQSLLLDNYQWNRIILVCLSSVALRTALPYYCRLKWSPRLKKKRKVFPGWEIGCLLKVCGTYRNKSADELQVALARLQSQQCHFSRSAFDRGPALTGAKPHESQSTACTCCISPLTSLEVSNVSRDIQQNITMLIVGNHPHFRRFPWHFSVFTNKSSYG